MADEKKSEGKTETKPAGLLSHPDPFVEIVSWGIFLLIVVYFLNSIFTFVQNSPLLSLDWNKINSQSILFSHARPVSSLENPIGTKVLNTRDSSLYDSPAGKEIGQHKIGSRGKILKGPVIVGGEKWWYVDYEDGEDGWVRENDIAVLESEPNFLERFLIWFLSHLWKISLIIIIITLLFILGVIYFSLKLSKIRAEQKALLYPVLEKSIEKEVNPKWQRILDAVESLNESDWRQAIIEGDIMLNEVLNNLALPGDTMSAKLKSVDKSDFLTLDKAWEAHKIRNQIAHDGASFALTQREARRVVELYRSIFEEFKII